MSSAKLLCCFQQRETIEPKEVTEEDAKEKERIETLKNDLFFRRERLRSVISNGDGALESIGVPLESMSLDEVYLLEVEHLGRIFESEAPKGLVNHMGGTDYTEAIVRNSTKGSPPPRNMRLSTFVADIPMQMKYDLSDDREHYNKLIGERECVIVDIVRTPTSGCSSRAFVRAGPRRELHFNPATVNAAVVTCGGLCPGLNNCIREITRTLKKTYGIKGKVFGIRGGYRGFYDANYYPALLTTELVENIHHKGGTVLTSSRGGFDLNRTVDFIKKEKINQLYSEFLS